MSGLATAAAQQTSLISDAVAHPKFGQSWSDFISNNPQATIFSLDVDEPANQKPDPHAVKGDLIKDDASGKTIYLFKDGKFQGLAFYPKSGPKMGGQILAEAKKLYGDSPQKSLLDSPRFKTEVYEWTLSDSIVRLNIPIDENATIYCLTEMTKDLYKAATEINKTASATRAAIASPPVKSVP